ncbi:MAG: FmdB family zinc ribbon protein [Candidatus Oxydemutatoraceae bacterium WSBS_2016_MAG_OTU14]
MPIYEYKCSNCEEHLEELQKLSAPELKDCPACNQPKLVRLVSPAGFRLSGSGWYETDFKTKNQRNLAGDQGSQSSKATEKPAPKGKPASAVAKDKSPSTAPSKKSTSSD